MALTSHGNGFVAGSLVWLVAVAVAATSCSESHGGDDDDDSSGEAGMVSGTPFSGRGGKSSGGNGAGAVGTTGGNGTGGNATGGATGTAGDGTTTGGTGTGGSGTSGDGNGTGGTDISNAGAGGDDCSGNDCAVRICGNGMLEPGEPCDDGNALPFDGCSASCEIEPACEGAACTGSCGDGIIVSGEECDDGNTASGDGCSADCAVEDGYTCTAAECDRIGGTCVVRLPAIFRDFNSSGATGGHPDFQPGFNSSGAVQGLVESVLDADGKPVQTATASTSETTAFMHGKAAFAQWYRNDPPASKPISGQIVLWDDGKGGYVNRWGQNGERWLGGQSLYYCGYGDCSLCPTPAFDQTCMLCPDLPTYSCLVTQDDFDGNPLFFPIDPPASALLTDVRGEGKVPDTYGWIGWQDETLVATTLGLSTPIPTATAPFPSTMHNFSFTTELKFFFRYDAAKTQILSFTGDDDMWLFVNGHLAGDLGGWHVPLDASVTIAGGTVTSVAKLKETTSTTPVTKTSPVADFGLEDGKVYQIAVFHAERMAEGSSFKLGISGLDVSRSTCVKD